MNVRRITVNRESRHIENVTLGDLRQGELFHEISGQYSEQTYQVLDTKGMAKHASLQLGQAYRAVANIHAGSTRIMSRSTPVQVLRPRNDLCLVEVAADEFFKE